MFKNSLYYLSSSVIIIAVNFLTLPVFTRYLSLSDYGKLALFVLFGSITTGILSFGLSTAAYRFFFKFDCSKFTSINSSILVCLSMLFFINGYLIVFPYSEEIASYLFDNSLSEKLIKLSFVSGCFHYFYQYFLNLLAAQKRANLVSFIVVLHAVNIALVTFYLIKVNSYKYEALIFSLFGANLLSCALVLLFNIKFISLKFNINRLIIALKFSYPETPGILIGIIHSSFDKTMLSKYQGVSSVGYYEFGSKFSIIVKHFMDAIEKSWTPFFMENAEINSNESKNSIIDRFYELAFLFGLIGLFVSFFSEEALILLTTENFYKAKFLIPLMVISVLFGTLGFLSVIQLMFAEKLVYILPVSILSVILNLTLNIILIPIYGAIGAVFSTAICSMISGIVLLYFANKVYVLLKSYKKIIQFFFVVILTSLLVYPVLFAEIFFLYKILLKIVLLLVYVFFALKIDLIDDKVLRHIKSFAK